jgi:hypothetical protein
MKLRRQAKLLWVRSLREVWKGLKVGLVEYWPQLLLVGAAIWCWLSLLDLTRKM